jgi:hypothetical protein
MIRLSIYPLDAPLEMEKGGKMKVRLCWGYQGKKQVFDHWLLDEAVGSSAEKWR